MGEWRGFALRLVVGTVVGTGVGLVYQFATDTSPAECEDTWHTKDHIKVTCENGSRLRVLPSGDVVCECPVGDGGSNG